MTTATPGDIYLKLYSWAQNIEPYNDQTAQGTKNVKKKCSPFRQVVC